MFDKSNVLIKYITDNSLAYENENLDKFLEFEYKDSGISILRYTS